MAKDPAFLFYPADWIGGTMGMTFEEKGAYMELLMLQFNRGHMTSHMVGQTVGQIFGQIKDKFKIDVDGLYYNERLDIEKDKRKAYTASRKNNIGGENQYTKKEGHMDGHMTSHMVNINKDVNTIEDRKILFKESLKKFVEKYGKDMMNEFYSYWTEPNKTGTKFKQESEKFWDLKRRLNTWDKNQKPTSGQAATKPQTSIEIKNHI